MASTDYQKIAHAIGYIRANHKQQPSLEDIAAQVHLSPYHFQRLFCRWAGVSPKRFLQALTLQHAKSLLKQPHATTMATSAELGLSSSSRLYDHFVQLNALTPLEYKQQGLGVLIDYGYHNTAFGPVFIGLTEKGICHLSFAQHYSPADLLAQLQAEWPQANFRANPVHTAAVVARIFNPPKNTDKPLSLWVRGTNFQINVWQALLRIPYGQVSSYGAIASQVHKPKAARAVGGAIGANPIAFIIPCHRVLQQSGGLGGFRWGEVTKHALLAKESAVMLD